MKKSEIPNLNNTDLFIAFNKYTVQLVKEANSTRGESKKTISIYDALVNECVSRFDLDRDKLEESDII